MQTMIYGCDFCGREMRQNDWPDGWASLRIYWGDDEAHNVSYNSFLACGHCAKRLSQPAQLAWVSNSEPGSRKESRP